MIRLRVRFFGPFRDVFGGREVEIDLPAEARIHDLLLRLSDTPERQKEIFAGPEVLRTHVVIMKNGVPVHGPDGLGCPLQKGDDIAIFPFLGGG